MNRNFGICCLSVLMAWTQADAGERPLTLQQAVAEALSNNPGIHAAQRRWNAARARVPQAKSWDDPRLSYDNVAGRFVDVPANAFTDQSLTVEQILPVSGKNLSRSRIAAAEALVAYEEMRRVQLDVVANVRTAWFRFIEANRQLALNSQDTAALSEIEKVTQARYQSGQESAPEILRVQIASSKLVEARLDLERKQSEAQTRLGVLMNRPMEHSIVPAGPAVSVASPRSLSEKTLVSRLLASRPEIRMAENRVEAERSRVQLAKREWIPDPAVNVNTQRYNEATQAVSQVGAGVSVSIPWVNPGKYREGVREAEENLAAAQAELQRVRSESLGMLKDQIKRIETAHHHYELYNGKILTQARQAFATAQANYGSGKAGFAEWIDADRSRREVEAMVAEMLAEYESALAELEALIGGESPTPPLKKAKP